MFKNKKDTFENLFAILILGSTYIKIVLFFANTFTNLEVSKWLALPLGLFVGSFWMQSIFDSVEQFKKEDQK